MKILIALSSDKMAWPYQLDLARGLSELGIEVLIAAECAEGEPNSEPLKKIVATVAGASLALLEMDEAHPKGEALARLARTAGADIVHLSDPALAADARFDRPVVVFHHGCVATRWQALRGGDLPSELGSHVERVRAGLLAACAVVAPTRAHALLVKGRYRLADLPQVVHVGRSPRKVRSSVPHDFAFTYGRLWDEGSNLRLLDDATGRIGVPVRAAGPIRGPNGVEVMFENIHWSSGMDDETIDRWLSSSPVFVSPALFEPLGLAAIEAASAGCPLILSNIPDHRELWQEVAIFVDPHDARGFSETISNLVGDDFERAVMGRAARERAALYSPQAMAAQMAAIYRSLLPAVRRPILAARAAA